jgi:thioesterase domain-containing protein
LSSSSLANIADRYAAQIMSRHPEGTMIHLLGFSAGGWYAHAVADALLRRGARIGLLAVFDAGEVADVHRGVRLVVLILRIVFRLRFHLAGVIASTDGQSRIDYTRRRFTALKGRVRDLFYRRRVDEISLRRAATAGGDPSDPDSDVYVVLLRGYRPPRLPVAVDLFGPPSRLGFLRPLWRFYARAGVRTHPMFEEHTDFLQPQSAGALAAALESALDEIEGMAGATPSTD